jgi:hypothetical protein
MIFGSLNFDDSLHPPKILAFSRRPLKIARDD